MICHSEIEKKTGAKYLGIQRGFGKVPDFHLWNSPITGTTFSAGSIESVMSKINSEKNRKLEHF